jgi:hypothetical protein
MRVRHLGRNVFSFFVSACPFIFGIILTPLTYSLFNISYVNLIWSTAEGIGFFVLDILQLYRPPYPKNEGAPVAILGAAWPVFFFVITYYFTYKFYPKLSIRWRLVLVIALLGTGFLSLPEIEANRSVLTALPTIAGYVEAN